MANFITMSRIFLALIAIGLLFIHTTPMYITAFFLTAIAIWFDGLDGFVARLLKEDSRFGAMLDILGDRIVENVYIDNIEINLPIFHHLFLQIF